MDRIKWRAKNATTWEDDLGDEIDLRQTPPGLLQKMLRDAVARAKERKKIKNIFLEKEGQQEQTGSEEDRRICIDHIAEDVGKKKWEEGLP